VTSKNKTKLEVKTFKFIWEERLY